MCRGTVASQWQKGPFQRLKSEASGFVETGGPCVIRENNFPFHQSARVIPVIVVITKFRRYRGLTRRQQRQRERNASNISTRNNRLNENSEYLFLRILIFLNNFIFFFFLPSLIVLIIVRFIS